MKYIQQRLTNSSAFEVKILLQKLKQYKSPGTDQIPAYLIQAGCQAMRFEVSKYIYQLCLE